MLAKIRTVGLVALITALVWILAESQTLRSTEASLPVALSDGGSTAWLIRAVPGQGWDDSVKVRLEGSAARLDELLDRARDRVQLRVGRELPAEPGEHAISLRDALRMSETFRESGVTIVETIPSQVLVQVDSVATAELPVSVTVPDGQLEGIPEAVPGTVTVRGPASLLAGLGEDASAVARVSRDSLASLSAGRPETVRVARVDLPESLRDGWGVHVEPAGVDVRLTIRSRTDTYSIPRLPVQVLLAPPELGRWSIEIPAVDQDLNDITLTGPSDAIARIRDREVRPVAVVALTFEELERGITSKGAEVVGLPAGVTYEVPNATVRLTIRRLGESDDRRENGPGE